MIFYIHGFNSKSSGNQKIDDFTTFLEREVKPLDYDSSASFLSNFNKLKEDVKNYKEKIFIGTSLGAFYASLLAKEYSGTAIMINPAIEPNKQLLKHVGYIENFTTKEKTFFSEETALSYPEIQYSEKTFIILNAGDEVINSFETIEKIQGKNYILFPNGSHRIENVEEISSYIKEWITSYEQ